MADIMATSYLTKWADLMTHHDPGTGALRTRRPDFVDFLPPCNTELAEAAEVCPVAIIHPGNQKRTPKIGQCYTVESGLI